MLLKVDGALVYAIGVRLGALIVGEVFEGFAEQLVQWPVGLLAQLRAVAD